MVIQDEHGWRGAGARYFSNADDAATSYRKAREAEELKARLEEVEQFLARGHVPSALRPKKTPEPQGPSSSEAPQVAAAPRPQQSPHAFSEYDVALSFAGEQREYVESVAGVLISHGLRVFYDRASSGSLWGKNLYEHLHEIYSRKATYTVVFVSREYAEKPWTRHEWQSAQECALKANREYILPVRFDDTSLPGLPETTAYLSARANEPADLARLVIEKVKTFNGLRD